MFWNYLVIALRNLRKHKLFAFINIVGLAVGLTTYIFTSLIVDYELSHDNFFEDSEQIFTVGTIPNTSYGSSFKHINSTFTAVGPLIDAEISDITAVSRVIAQLRTVSVDNNPISATISFVDAGFTDIFKFSYIDGDEHVLKEPHLAVITESMAMTLFGKLDVIGQAITLDNRVDFQVAALIEDIPANSHFNLSQGDPQPAQQIFTSIDNQLNVQNVDVDKGHWNGFFWKDLTYVRLPEHLDGAWLEDQLKGVFDRHVPERNRVFAQGFSVSPLYVASMADWDRRGIPIITLLPLLGLLILLVAGVNYANLAVAQSLGRSREIGMRKTMGASQQQLLAQFLFESLITAAVAMLISVAVLELTIPLFNNQTGKMLNLNYQNTLPWLLATTISVGLLAGLYPAWLITKMVAIDALKEKTRRGRSGAKTRSVMIGTQFVISIFMLASVAIVYTQNKKMEDQGNIFPHSDVYFIYRMSGGPTGIDRDLFKQELEKTSVIEAVAYSSQTPFMNSHRKIDILTEQGEEASKMTFYTLDMSSEFLEVFDIPITAGRNLDKNITQDLTVDDVSEIANILVNETLLDSLGISTPHDAINQRLFASADDEDSVREFVIVGVMADRNIHGLSAGITPWIFFLKDQMKFTSIRFQAGADQEALQQIETTWKSLAPQQPFVVEPLTNIFDREYAMFRVLGSVLATLAFIAVVLAIVGLFGLASFISVQRTKEVGIRKVLGASTYQIIKLLVMQLSKPIFWALLVALPSILFAARFYLSYFADPVEYWIFLIFGSAVVILLVGWVVIAGQTYRVAATNPVNALRHE